MLGAFLAGSPGIFFCGAMLVIGQSAEPKTPDDFLAEVHAVGEPPFDPARKEEPGYLQAYRTAQHELCRRKAGILLDLIRRHSGDPRVPEWVNRRWVLLGWNQGPKDVADEVLADITAQAPQWDHPQIARDAAYWTAFYRSHRASPDAATMLQHADLFAHAHPEDERGAMLLRLAAEAPWTNPVQRIGMYRRLAADYPGTHDGKYAPGKARRLESLGKPFAFSFRDAISDRPVSSDALRGKIVVIDFWATTCGPCVGAIPTLKKLYAEVHPRGVEFIGVSLDEPEDAGGLRALREAIKKHDIPWPQFYQGNGYDSEFSKSWGVGGAPTVFVLDAEGKLRTDDAAENLEEWIRRLLQEP